MQEANGNECVEYKTYQHEIQSKEFNITVWLEHLQSLENLNMKT